ncbi:fibronectin type III domain-containing protein [Candidatus Peregrinibacteria bacterium]|nr:fibronectin type III domain-containing protein [Candidatus Peregrinibacteria bacterium]
MKIKIIVISVLLLLFTGQAYGYVQISPLKSTLSPKNQVVNSYDEKALISVQLLDEDKQPVSGHKVKLIASSEDVNIRAIAATSDEAGKALFEAGSYKKGVVTYAAYDITADVLLSQRAKVAYFDSISFAKGSPAGKISKLEFDDVDENIKPGDSVTFTLIAKDDNDENVVNYNGKVDFSIKGNDVDPVELPEDYTFTVEDQGEHTFSLALTFTKSGLYEVTATDSEDFEVQGSYVFDVKDGSNAALDNDITLSNPIAGTYSNNVVVVRGKAGAGNRLKVFDNEIAIGSMQADADGNFTFTTAALDEGAHKIYAASVDETGTIISPSKTVDITVDTVVPEITKVELEPAGPVDPNSSVKIKLYASEELAKVQLNLGGNVYDLLKTNQGFYSANIAAPIEFGDYPLNFSVEDALGNKASFENQATLKVGVFNGSGKAVPGDVKNVRVVSGNGKITLQWDPAVPAVNPIENYRIYYGTAPNSLTNAVDTFSNATTWYVSGLNNGIPYYFGVAAVDTRGNISANFQQIASGTPTSSGVAAALPPDIVHGSAGKDALKDLPRDASESGPEIWWLLILSLFGGVFYGKMRSWIKSRL